MLESKHERLASFGVKHFPTLPIMRKKGGTKRERKKNSHEAASVNVEKDDINKATCFATAEAQLGNTSSKFEKNTTTGVGGKKIDKPPQKYYTVRHKESRGNTRLYVRGQNKRASSTKSQESLQQQGVKPPKVTVLIAPRRQPSSNIIPQRHPSTYVAPQRKPSSNVVPRRQASNNTIPRQPFTNLALRQWSLSPKKASKAKKFVSLPIRTQSLKDLAAKALLKREPKEGPKSANEDSYPRPRRSKTDKQKKDNSQQSEALRITASYLFTNKTTEIGIRTAGNTLPYTGLPMVRGNNDNNGVIIVNEQPFWVTELPLDESDQAHVMNATLLIDVLENRIKLIPMPDIEIDFDPMKEINEIADQDKCFTEDILFGNTVRSMVNLNEFSVRTLSIKNRKKAVNRVNPNELKQLPMKEPTKKHTYYRATYQRFDVIPFTPSLKKPTETPNEASLFPTVANVA